MNRQLASIAASRSFNNSFLNAVIRLAAMSGGIFVGLTFICPGMWKSVYGRALGLTKEEDKAGGH